MSDHLDSTAGQVDTNADHLDNGLSLPEAAERLGVSERTIRRRIKEGSLPASKLETPQGHVWRVHLDGTVDHLDGMSTRRTVHLDNAARQAPGTADQMDSEAIEMALELAQQLQRDNAALAGRNEQLAGQVGFLQAKLQDAQEEVQQLRLLMAPKDDPAEEHPAPAEPEQKRPWWRRLTRRG